MRVLDFSNDDYFSASQREGVRHTWIPLVRRLHPHPQSRSRPRTHWLKAGALLLKARMGGFDWVILPPLHLNYTTANPFHQRIIKAIARPLGSTKFTSRLIRLLLFAGKCGYVIFDPSDYTQHLGKEMVRMSGAKLYFKRNLDETLASTVIEGIEWHPLPMIFEDQWLDQAHGYGKEKRTLFFSAGQYQYSQLRINLLETGHILSRKGAAVDLLESNISLEEFWGRVAASHFCAAAQGVGYHTWRMFESAALGSIPVVNPQPPGLWGWFRDMENCVFMEPEPEQTADKLVELARQPETLEKIRAASIRCVEEFHRASRVGHTILALLEKRLSRCS